MTVDRLLPTQEAADLIDLVREIGDAELRPRVSADEKAGRFPRDVFATLGKAGLLGLPFPERYGGGNQPYEVYLQALEEIGARWASVGVGVSVQTLTCFPLLNYGTEQQRERWLSELIGGDLLGAYCLSEPDAGSDPGAMRTRATRTERGWRIDGTKAWVSHGGLADFYTVFARTGDGSRGISCFLVPADAPGLTAGEPEQKMGLTGSTTTVMHFDGVEIEAD
ncbi:MAG TPA: acyl-CoA dehydrogenase family protein, partial [Mycobacteriales bacterium]